MNCRDLRDRLLDASPQRRGTLSGPEVDAHLAACADCRDEVDRLEGLWARASALEAPGGPVPDAWPEIRERLAQRSLPESGASSGRPLRQVAAAVLLLFTGGLADRVLLRGVAGPGAPESFVAEVPSATPAGVDRASVDRGRDGFRTARAELWRLALSSDRFRPDEVVDGLLLGLAAVEDARAALEIALADDPTDSRLLGLLERTRRRELDLLRRLAVPGPSPARRSGPPSEV